MMEEWYIVKNHVNDEIIKQPQQKQTWEVNGQEKFFSMFQIGMTDMNSNGNWVCHFL